MELHLDGVISYTHIAEYHSSSTCCLQRELWARVTLCAHALIALVATTIRQSIRFVEMLITGVFTFNAKRLYFAFQDLLSIPVQAIALPLLGIIGTFSPKHVYHASAKLWSFHPTTIGSNSAPLQPVSGYLVHVFDQTDEEKTSLINTFFSRVFYPIQVLNNSIFILTHFCVALSEKSAVISWHSGITESSLIPKRNDAPPTSRQ